MSSDAAHAPRVYLGTLGVFLGAGISSLSQRLLSVGLPDLRGALGLGFDQAAWIPTVANVGLMFMGPFTIYLGAMFGWRRVLLTAGTVFTLASLLLPLAPNLTVLLVLQAIAGLAMGTFYPLTLSFALSNLPPRHTIYAIGVYSLELVGALAIGTPLQAWYVEHLSWRWIFWNSAVLTPLMMVCVYFAIPHPPPQPGPRPTVSWRGFLYASLGLSAIYAAVEQGERLNWLESGTIWGLLAAGGFLIVAMVIRRWRTPNPMVDFRFLLKRNTLILGAGLFSVRTVLLSAVFLIPGYLGAVQGYRALETGRVLLLMVPVAIAMGLVAVQLMKVLDGRLVLGLGFATIALACLMTARLTSGWAGDDFMTPLVVLATGLAFIFVGQIGMVGQQLLDSGALQRPAYVMTYSSFFQTVRIFGAAVGTTILQRIITLRGRFHSSMVGLNVVAGDWLSDERLRTLTGVSSPGTSGADDAQARAVALLAGQVKREVTTLSYADGFVFVAVWCATILLALAFMKPLRNYYSSAVVVPPRAP